MKNLLGASVQSRSRIYVFGPQGQAENKGVFKTDHPGKDNHIVHWLGQTFYLLTASKHCLKASAIGDVSKVCCPVCLESVVRGEICILYCLSNLP